MSVSNQVAKRLPRGERHSHLLMAGIQLSFNNGLGSFSTQALTDFLSERRLQTSQSTLFQYMESADVMNAQIGAVALELARKEYLSGGSFESKLLKNLCIDEHIDKVASAVAFPVIAEVAGQGFLNPAVKRKFPEIIDGADLERGFIDWLMTHIVTSRKKS